MASLYSNSKHQACLAHASKWEETFAEHYRTIACLKPIQSNRRDETVCEAFEKIKTRVTETREDVLAKKQEYLCVLPVGHSGKCTHQPHKNFLTNKVIAGKLDWIYTTPGDDDYIYKNRCHRLFPIAVPDELEKVWRDKNIKLKCAIPLREASTPLLMATAYVDYMTLILSVEGIYEHIKLSYEHLSDIQALADVHAANLVDYYGQFKRRIFDSERYTICPVTTKRIRIEDLANNDIKDANAIQLGHVVPRSETEFTIRGKNVLLMSRRGNLLVGDDVFTEDAWLDCLKGVIAGHSL